MSDTHITFRRKQIFVLLKRSPKPLTCLEIKISLKHQKIYISKSTLVRDLHTLLYDQQIQKVSNSIGTKYRANQNPILNYIDPKDYFSKKAHQRSLVEDRRQFFVIGKLDGLLSESEKIELDQLNCHWQFNRSSLNPAIRRSEFHRFLTDSNWESQRKIFQHISLNKFKYQELQIEHILEIQAILAKEKKTSTGLRAQPIGIPLTRYRPPPSSIDIQISLNALTWQIYRAVHPVEKALIALTGINSIHPFEELNREMGWLIANTTLVALDYPPISASGLNEEIYERSIILFYEQHNIFHLKRLFLDQLKLTVSEYCRTSE